MIAQLTGTVVRTEGSSVVLDVNGVGYLVSVPVPVLSALPGEANKKVTLLTHLVGRAQPDFELALYGFLEPADLHAFRLLIAVSGVGARVALALLSAFAVSELARALTTNDTKTITKAPGVGPKLAQRLCLELGDKMAAFSFEQRIESAEGRKTEAENAAYEDVIDALVGLGWGRPDARRAADRALATATDRANTALLISTAMQILTSGKK